MKTVVIYESMYGNTHHVAEAIAAGALEVGAALVVPAAGATPELLSDADLVVVGAPTHVHTMPSATSRKGAAQDAGKKGLELEADADGPGVRDWLGAVGSMDGTRAAAFDTRVQGKPLLTGRASKSIGAHLRRRGFVLVAEPESFLVDRSTQLVAGELERARRWGEQVARSV